MEWSVVLAALTLAGAASAMARQDTVEVPITGGSLGGFVLPSLPLQSDIRIEAVRGWSWREDDTQRLQLEGDVRLSFGAYQFASPKAFLWIDRIPSEKGLINQLAIFFPTATEPTRRAGLGAAGTNLLVTGSAMGEVILSLVETYPHRPATSTDLSQAQDRLANYLSSIAAGGASLTALPSLQAPAPVIETAIEVGASPAAASASTVTPRRATTTRPRESAIISPQGVLSFYGETIEVNEADDSIAIVGGVMVDYRSMRGGQDLQLSAERTVIFLHPGTIGMQRSGEGVLDASKVSGIYLEGGVVATDFSYTLRGNRIYYDLRANRAIILDAVLRTAMRSGIPVIARAKEMRQLAADQWEADSASVSMSEFFTPHLSVGVERIQISTLANGDTWVEGEDATLRANGTPFFYWPQFSGTPQDMPLKSINMGFNDYQGAAVDSTWDVWQLLGIAPPRGVEGELFNEIYSKNGVGIGARFASNDDGEARLEGFGFYDFQNQERTSSGGTVTSSDAARGYALGEYTNRPEDTMLLQFQMAYISDSTFINTFRWDEFAEHREYTSSALLDSSTGNSTFSLQGVFNINDFVSNSYMLASRPYSVNKIPEAAYARYGDSLFDESVTWSSEYSANAMQLKVTSGTPANLGINQLAFAQSFASTDSVSAEYADAGYDNTFRSRIYTRQELAAPIRFAGGCLTPFTSATGIGYLNGDFQDYNSNAQNYRFLVAGGARGSAEFTQSFDTVQSRAFDLHRLRHIVKPNGTLWYGWDSGSPLNQPVYDQEVEAISAAAAMHLALDQTLQTMRGGPGAWHSVDFLSFNVGGVLDSKGSSYQQSNSSLPASLQYGQAPAPVFYSWRPEYSQWGDHIYARMKWQASDALSLYGQGSYVLEQSRENSVNSFGLSDLARGTLGTSVQQSPDVRLFCEYRYVNTFDDTGTYPADEFIQGGVAYQISKKYSLTMTPQWDLVANDFRAFGATLDRTFPDFDLRLGYGYDAIVQESFFSLALRINATGGGTGVSSRALSALYTDQPAQ